MRKKNSVQSIVLLIAVFIFIAAYLYVIENKREENLSKPFILFENDKDIAYFEIKFGGYPNYTYLCKFDDKASVSELYLYMKASDYKRKTGHIYPVIEFVLDIYRITGFRQSFLGFVYDKYPKDVYLEVNNWRKQNKSTYSRVSMASIRLIGASDWLRKIEKQCKQRYLESP